MLAAAAVAGATVDPSLHVQRLTTGDLGWWVAYFTFSIVGGLVAARRPGNRVGWLMLIAGAVNALAEGAGQYGVWGLVRHPGSLPGADVASWLSSYAWTPAITALVLVLAYFPDGRLASRRWRWVPALALACTTVIVVTSGLNLWSRRGPALLADNADVVKSTYAAHVINVLWPFVPICAIAAMASIAVRWRRSHGAERQQLKWLVLAGVVSAPMIIVGEVMPHSSRFYVVAELLNSPAWCAIAIALAVLRYRLYEIDRIVSRTVSYAVITGLLIGVYVGGVALTTRLLPLSSSVGVAASTLAAAALFQPLRQRVQRGVDRRFNRERYDANRTVDAFAARLRDEVDADAVRDDLLDTVVTAVAPANVSLWVPA
jgi:hypothetical protein